MKSPSCEDGIRIRERIRREGRRPVRESPLESYILRAEIATILSLLLVIGFVKIPAHYQPEGVGWVYHTHDDEAIHVVNVRESWDAPGSALPLLLNADSFRDVDPVPPDQENEPGYLNEADMPSTEDLLASRVPPPQRIQQRSVLRVAEKMPRPEGGLGSIYLRINYPEAAREKGIEGRVQLGFVVEINGQVSNLRVIQSAHPLLDSAAVHALRSTRFVPARQDGEIVRVAMQLPIRFQIVNRTEPLADQLKNPNFE